MNSGEPLINCFDCGKAKTLEQLTRFPWWDPHLQAVDSMYFCERCLSKAHKRLLKELGANAAMLQSFVEFAERRVSPPTIPASTDALAIARQTLDALAARKAFVMPGGR
jgi:hypothetical protein